MTKITNFVWNPVDDCIISELDETGAVQAVYTNEPQQYGGVISQRRGTTSHYHHHDALGSTRFLTDGSGTVTDTYLNDAWGNSVVSTGTTVNPFKWVGKYGYYTDDSTRQVYVRARMYQPTAARWVSMDPIWQNLRSGLWEYSNNSPPAVSDPSGLEVPTYAESDVRKCRQQLEQVAKAGWFYFPLASALLQNFLDGGGDVNYPNWFFDMRDRIETIRPALFFSIVRTLPPACDYNSELRHDNRLLSIAFPKGGRLGNDLYWAINRAQILLTGSVDISCGEMNSIRFLIPNVNECCCSCSLTGSVGGEIRDTYDFCSSYSKPTSILGGELDFPRCGCILEDWAKKHPTEANGRYNPFSVRIKLGPEQIKGNYYACLASGTIRSYRGEIWAQEEYDKAEEGDGR